MNIRDIRMRQKHSTNKSQRTTTSSQRFRKNQQPKEDNADVIIKRWEDYTGEQVELIEDAG